jgi:hypothetical protein
MAASRPGSIPMAASNGSGAGNGGRGLVANIRQTAVTLCIRASTPAPRRFAADRRGLPPKTAVSGGLSQSPPLCSAKPLGAPDWLREDQSRLLFKKMRESRPSLGANS